MPLDSHLLADYESLTQAVGWILDDRRTVLEISGGDRAKFLHNLCTNDVKSLEAGEGCEAFFTNVQGKILAHAFLYADDDAIALDTVSGQAEPLLNHLERYHIREDVQIADRSGESGQIFVIGPHWEQLLSSLAPSPSIQAVPNQRLSHREIKLAGATVRFTRPGWGPEGCWLRWRRDDLSPLGDALAAQGGRRCSPDVLEALRIEAGFPAYDRDITDKNLPQEVDRDKFAISFRKGCYLGQETVARIDALGHVNRLLKRVKFSGDEAPPAGAPLHRESQMVGTVTSSVYSPSIKAPLALAYLRREASQPGAELTSPFGIATVLANE